MRINAATDKIHCQKSNCIKLVQMQVDKAIQNKRQLKSYISELQSIHSAFLQKERRAKHAAIQLSKHWKQVANKRMKKITELKEVNHELKDNLARVTQEMKSNCVLNKAMTLATQVELKRVSQGGKLQPRVVQYICELLVIGTPPTSIPSIIITTSYQTYYGKEPIEVPQISFVCQCHVIAQVIGETVAAIKLASAAKWDQFWTDATT